MSTTTNPTVTSGLSRRHMGKGQSHPLIKQVGGWSDLQDAAGSGKDGWVASDHLAFAVK